jgi:hypothetical protein
MEEELPVDEEGAPVEAGAATKRAKWIELVVSAPEVVAGEEDVRDNESGGGSHETVCLGPE